MLYHYKIKRGVVLSLMAFLFISFGTSVIVQAHANKETTKSSQTEKTKAAPFFSFKNLKKIFLEKKSTVYVLIFAFITGLLTSFTPCIYPMIPITLGVLQVQGTSSLLHNFLISLTYVLGISVVYAALGYLAATTTLILGQWLANPWLIFFVILFFIYLAFSMFGFYEIKLPGFLQKRIEVKTKGSYLSTFVFGMISGTVASPCLTPAIAILLTFVAKEANPFLGFLTLWVFALGLGVLLIIIGTFSASMSLLPRAGSWMIEVKNIFGFLLLAISVYFLTPFFGFYLLVKFYAVLALIASIYYFLTSKKSIIKILFGLLLAFLFLFLLSWGMAKRTDIIALNFNPTKGLQSLYNS